MERLSVERIFLYNSYMRSGESLEGALKKWRSQRNGQPVPSRSTVHGIVERFNRTGSVGDDTEALKTSQKRVRTPELITAVKEVLSEDPRISVRNLGRRLNISRETARTILADDLSLHPYKIQIVQPLTIENARERSEFANEICDLIDTKKLKPERIIFTDEAHFWLNGYVNRQNFRVWGSENPHMSVSRPLHPEKVTVWAGICSEGLIGPIFLHDKELINGEIYHRLLQEAFEKIDDLGLGPDFFWQQDGAPPHRTEVNLSLLRSRFGKRVIAKGFKEKFGEGINWPPYSPDLSACDFFLWGFLKDKVYKSSINSKEELRDRIRGACSELDRATCTRVISSFEKRVRMLTLREGWHIEDVMV